MDKAVARRNKENGCADVDFSFQLYNKCLSKAFPVQEATSPMVNFPRVVACFPENGLIRLTFAVLKDKRSLNIISLFPYTY